jgi:hypothetical protein
MEIYPDESCQAECLPPFDTSYRYLQRKSSPSYLPTHPRGIPCTRQSLIARSDWYSPQSRKPSSRTPYGTLVSSNPHNTISCIFIPLSLIPNIPIAIASPCALPLPLFSFLPFDDCLVPVGYVDETILLRLKYSYMQEYPAVDLGRVALDFISVLAETSRTPF